MALPSLLGAVAFKRLGKLLQNQKGITSKIQSPGQTQQQVSQQAAALRSVSQAATLSEARLNSRSKSGNSDGNGNTDSKTGTGERINIPTQDAVQASSTTIQSNTNGGPASDAGLAARLGKKKKKDGTLSQASL